jgi:hypothetical protein
MQLGSKVGILEEFNVSPRIYICICQHENSHPSMSSLFQRMAHVEPQHKVTVEDLNKVRRNHSTEADVAMRGM